MAVMTTEKIGGEVTEVVTVATIEGESIITEVMITTEEGITGEGVITEVIGVATVVTGTATDTAMTDTVESAMWTADVDEMLTKTTLF